jgi:uncharacterized protein with HEPN domain
MIGEAARRLSQEFRDRHPKIPWRGWIGLRNVMAHEYDEIDHRRVWNVVKDRLPQLLEVLAPLLPSAPPEQPG